MTNLRTRLLVTSLALCVACKSKQDQPVSPTSQTKDEPASVALASAEPPSADITKFQNAARQFPDNAVAWASLAQAWVKHARSAQSELSYDRAEDACKRALKIEPTQQSALHVQVILHHHRRRFGEEKLALQKILAADPNDARAWGLLSDAELELGRYDAAAAAAQQMMDRAPGLAAFSRAAYLRWSRGDVDGSIALWQQAIRAGDRRDPEPLVWCLAELGDVYWHTGRIEDASQHFAAALKLKPDDAAALGGRGRVRFANGDQAGALADLTASVNARPIARNVRWLANVSGKAPTWPPGSEREESIYLADAGNTSAVELATKDPSRVLAHDVAVAWALSRAGKHKEAVEYATRAVRQGIEEPWLRARAGLVFDAAGEAADALDNLERALALNPHATHPLTEQVRAVHARLSMRSEAK